MLGVIPMFTFKGHKATELEYTSVHFWIESFALLCFATVCFAIAARVCLSLSNRVPFISPIALHSSDRTFRANWDRSLGARMFSCRCTQSGSWSDVKLYLRYWTWKVLSFDLKHHSELCFLCYKRATSTSTPKWFDYQVNQLKIWGKTW